MNLIGKRNKNSSYIDFLEKPRKIVTIPENWERFTTLLIMNKNVEIREGLMLENRDKFYSWEL